jgi:hypothetical protein
LRSLTFAAYWRKGATAALGTIIQRLQSFNHVATKLLISLAQLPSFRDAYRHRRCLVPVNNFFEWKAIKPGTPKQPYAIGMKGGEPFALAGIWENWKRPGSEEWVRTFAIITTMALVI